MFLAAAAPAFGGELESDRWRMRHYVPGEAQNDRRRRDTFGVAAIAFEFLTGYPESFSSLNSNHYKFDEYSRKFGGQPDPSLVRALLRVAEGRTRTISELKRGITGQSGKNKLAENLLR